MLSILLCCIAPLQGATITHGPFVGHVDTQSMHLWARVSEPGLYHLVVTPRGKGSGQSRSFPARATEESDLTLHWKVGSLETDHEYRCAVLDAGREIGTRPTLRVRTAPGLRAKRVALAFGSCASERRFPEQGVWSQMRASGVQALVLLGDTPYIDSTDLAVQRARYGEFFGQPALNLSLRGLPIYATWDDHDFGRNDTDGRLAGKENSRRAFIENHALQSYGNGETGIYTSFRRGPVEVFLLDTRWYSGTEPSAFDPAKLTLLGAAQWNWLMEGLSKSDAPFKILACGMIWNGATRPFKTDHWDHYPHERAGLMQFLGVSGIRGVVLIGGDIHRSRVLQYPAEQGAGYVITELITSPMANSVIALANAPSEHLRWDAGLPQTWLRIVVDAARSDALMTAEFWNVESGGIVHEVTLRASELAR